MFVLGNEYYLECVNCEKRYEDLNEECKCDCGGELIEKKKKYISFDEYMKEMHGQSWDGFYNDYLVMKLISCKDELEIYQLMRRLL